MSENIDRRERDFSEYRSMSTEQLQEILRLDAHQTDDAETDTEKMFYIMEVLAERKRNDTNYTGKTVQQAYETFQTYYMPEEKAAVKKFPVWLRRVSAAAAVLALVLLITVSADAFGFDLWGRFAHWTEEIFTFTDDPRETSIPEPARENLEEYTSLQNALDRLDIDQRLAPTWLPDGYVFEKIDVVNNPYELYITAGYANNGTKLTISIRRLSGGAPEYVEKSKGFIEAYDTNGITYYIFSNNSRLHAAWIVGEFECYIAGKLTIEEMKAIIDSI